MTDQAVVELEVIYGGSYGPDLAEAADTCGLTEQALINKHSQQTYQVFALGFSPGFAFMGETDKAIQLPRRSATKSVRAGSVAIAENQTAISPKDSPGGWHIIGQTPMAMFEITEQCFSPAITPGQQVTFKAIDYSEYCRLGGIISLENHE